MSGIETLTLSFPVHETFGMVLRHITRKLREKLNATTPPTQIQKRQGLDCILAEDATRDILKAYWETVPYNGLSFDFVKQGQRTPVNPSSTFLDLADGKNTITLQWSHRQKPSWDKHSTAATEEFRGEYWLHPRSFAFVIIDKGNYYKLMELRNENVPYNEKQGQLPQINAADEGEFRVAWGDYAFTRNDKDEQWIYNDAIIRGTDSSYRDELRDMMPQRNRKEVAMSLGKSLSFRGSLPESIYLVWPVQSGAVPDMSYDSRDGLQPPDSLFVNKTHSNKHGADALEPYPELDTWAEMAKLPQHERPLARDVARPRDVSPEFASTSD